jgi:hypothetical protein
LRPWLEALEDRSVPSTLNVTSNADTGAKGTLRWAVGVADAGSTPDTIDVLTVRPIVLTQRQLVLSKSMTIEANAGQATVSGNGADRIFDVSGSASVSISGLTLTDGLATSGGAILLEGSAALNLSDCTLSDNEAYGSFTGGGFGGGFGGAIEDNSSGALSVTNSGFHSNKAIANSPNEPTIPNDITAGYIQALGGAIDVAFDSNSPATISNSTFTGNQALGGVAGASAGGGALSDSSLSNAPMTVTNCTLCDNAAIGDAGGDGMVNFSSGQGGGINNFASMTVRDSTISGNLAQGTPLAPGVAPSQAPLAGSSVAGGGIFCLTNLIPATLTVTNSTLACNQAVGGAGAPGSAGSLAEGGGISVVAGSSADVSGCTLASNVAQGGAGGAGAVGGDGVSGGIDLAFFASVTVSNTILIGNQALGGAGGAGAVGGDGVGGAINVGTNVLVGFTPYQCSLTLTNCLLAGNQAQGGAGSDGGNGWGGGLSILTGSTAAVSTSAIVANLAQGGAKGHGGADGQGIGGGLYIDSGAAVTLATSSDVVFNFASTSADDVFGVYTT